jgi:hypothetical protein
MGAVVAAFGRAGVVFIGGGDGEVLAVLVVRRGILGTMGITSA